MLGKLSRGSSVWIATRGSSAARAERRVPLPQPPPRRLFPIAKPTPRVAMLPSMDLELDDDDDIFVDTATGIVANDAGREARVTLPGPPPEPPRAPAPSADVGLVREALSSQEARVIVASGEDELRARLHAEVLAIVRGALAAMPAQKAALDIGAAVRWMLVGVVLGAMVIYVLMASALHRSELLLAQASTPATVFVPQAAPPPPVTKGAPLMCPANAADVIPTVDVNALPKTKPPAPRVVRRAGTSAGTSTGTNTSAEENPYEGVSPDGTAAEPTL